MKKLKILCTITCMLLANSLLAQEVASFQVDNQHFTVLNSIVDMNLDIYSTKHGGIRMKIEAIEKNKEFLLEYNIKNKPAFVLNRKTESNPSGTNQVTHVPSQEFILKDIQLDYQADLSIISWNASIKEGEQIDFELYEIVNQVETRLTTILGSVSANQQTYSYTTPFKEDASYILKVVKNKTKIRYERNINKFVSSEIIEVYPTLTQNQIFVELGRLPFANYYLFSLNGQLVKKGILQHSNGSISLKNIRGGLYVLKLKSDTTEKSFKITKVD